jgi:hypothetical protein
MSETWTPELVVDWRIEAILNLLGIIAVAAAAFHVGQTGDWLSLMGSAMLLAMIILFVNPE